MTQVWPGGTMSPLVELIENVVRVFWDSVSRTSAIRGWEESLWEVPVQCSTFILHPTPILYLKGVSTNDFADALRAILGENAAGLSPTTITRLKGVWREEYEEWTDRDLSD